MKTSIILINYNTPDLVYAALASLRAHPASAQQEYIVVDNGSHKRVTQAQLGSDVVLIANEDNRGFAPAVNQGAARATGDYLVFFNSDAQAHSHALAALIATMERDTSIAVMGPHLVYETGETQVSCGRFPTVWREFLKMTKLDRVVSGGSLLYDVPANRAVYAQASDVDWVSGGCLAVRADVFKELDGFDETFFFGIEDVDFCYRVRRAGKRVVFEPSQTVVHHHGQSTGGKRSLFRLQNERFGIVYFLRKHALASAPARGAVWLMHSGKIAVLRIARKIS